MIVKLPVIKSKFNEEAFKEGQDPVVQVREYMDVEIDTSFRAHHKFDVHFAEDIKDANGNVIGRSNLVSYVERATQWMKSPISSKANYLSLLKLLYCFVNTDKLPTFNDFLGLLQPDTVDEIMQKIRIVLTHAQSTASKN